MSETVFYQRLQKLCEEKGISITALADAIGKGSATASGWKKGSIPRPDTIRLVADYFGVSTGFLTGDESVRVNNVHTNNGAIGNFHAPPKQNKANPFEDILVFQDCFALIIKIADRV